MSKGLPGICGGWPLAVLMLRVGKTGGLGPSAGYVSGCGEPFYGTRVDPGWYQTGTSVPRVRNPPFSLLRGLIQLRLAGWDDGPFGKSYYKLGQAFEPAGWRGLPAPREHPNDWKVAGTCRQESQRLSSQPVGWSSLPAGVPGRFSRGSSIPLFPLRRESELTPESRPQKLAPWA